MPSISCDEIRLWIGGQRDLPDEVVARHLDVCPFCAEAHSQYHRAGPCRPKSRNSSVAVSEEAIHAFLAAHLDSWDPATQRGSFLDFEEVEVLAWGGMGVVLKARDKRLNRPVAVKILMPEDLADAASKRRFRKEAETLALLEHDNIVTIFDVGEHNGMPYLSMSLLQGKTLAQRLAERGGPLDRKEVLAIASQVASALRAAHDSKVIHRDLKPGNIWIKKRGPDDELRVVLLDFGLAKRLDHPDSTVTASVGGTALYMSPEQARGESDLDGRSDMFSLGTVLYEMCTGRNPFLPSGGAHDHDMRAILNRVQEFEPPLLSNEEWPELNTLIRKLHEKQRKDRPYAPEVVRRLNEIAEFCAAIPAKAYSSPPGAIRAPQPLLSRRTILGFGAGAVAGAAATAAFLAAPRTPYAAAPPLQYLPKALVAGEVSSVFHVNAAELGKGARYTELPQGGYRIARQPPGESFYGLMLTVRSGGDYESWAPYREGELKVVYRPGSPGQKLKVKAENAAAAPGSGVIGEASLPADQPPESPAPLTHRIPVQDLVAAGGEEHRYRVTRLTIQADLNAESQEESWFEVHEVLLIHNRTSGE